MGAWGPGIFEDDVAADVQVMWEAAAAAAESAESATAMVLRDLGSDVIDDTEDGPVLWIALAALQLGSGAVTSEVKDRALAGIPANVERWREDASPAVAAEREELLTALRDRLMQPA